MWIIFGILTSLIGATYDLCNQISKLKTEIFIIYRGILVALLTTPVALLWFHVFPWQFYVISLFQGFGIAYMDYKYFENYHKFGAENVNAVNLLRIFLVFVLWLILKPSMIDAYLDKPLQSVVILASMVTMVYAVLQFRKQKIGLSCLQVMFPILCLSAVIVISNKFIMDYNDGFLLTLTIHRVAITGWIIGLINLFIYVRKVKSYQKPPFHLHNMFQINANYQMIPFGLLYQHLIIF